MSDAWFTYPAAAAALLVAALALRGVSVNRVVRSRLRLTILLFTGLLAIHLALAWAPLPEPTQATLRSVARLLLALGVIHLLVLVAINPLRADRVPERFPTIVQDAIIIALFAIVATLVFDEKFLTTSAVGAVVVGFALQDTLGNMFSGLAIQIERPFHVGHWISAGAWEGHVAEINWRATRIRTRHGNVVTVPNTELAKEAITNYSEPAAPTRIHVEIGASYAAQPTHVKRTLEEVLAGDASVLKTPAPLVLLDRYGDSSIVYRANFWIENPLFDEVVRDHVLCGIYYAFSRAGIEIPFPIQVEVSREEKIEAEDDRAARLARLLDGVELFAALSADERRELARGSHERLHGSGEAIVRQGEPGSSAFVIVAGRVRVTIAPGDQEVAIIERGGFFGEMSLLTGEPRTATVTAAGDCRVVEITASAFREIVLNNPAIVDAVSAEVSRRRAGLEQARDAAARATPALEPPASLLARVRRFLLGGSARTT
jgi:small-conductance mechanosensitive channel/CRP-like cAMP-binding protein